MPAEIFRNLWHTREMRRLQPRTLPEATGIKNLCIIRMNRILDESQLT